MRARSAEVCAVEPAERAYHKVGKIIRINTTQTEIVFRRKVNAGNFAFSSGYIDKVLSIHI